MKKAVIAMDSFKGSLTALEACRAVETGFRRSGGDWELELVPMADGGEGTADGLIRACGGQRVTLPATGVFGEPVEGYYGLIHGGTTAVVETAAVSGIAGIPETELNPLEATTYGTGQLLRAALEQGIRNLIIGFGGSATTDGGMGALQALGVRFYDRDGGELGRGGKEMERAVRMDVSGLIPAAREARFTFACDVENPLYGPTGAAAVFGPQKGASPAMVDRLDQGLRNLAAVIYRDTGRDIAAVPGAGAAGGLAGGLLSVLNADMVSGFQVLCDAAGLETKISGADLAVTGEGKTDDQTACGKLVCRLGDLAKRHGVPAVCISGTVLPCARNLYDHGITALFSAADRPMGLDSAMENAALLLENAAENVARLLG